MRTIRVTGGSLRSRTIEVLEHTGARYTPSKVREAIFNIIGSVEGKRVLDLFAGSGSFSIEALSRGAAWATLVEGNGEMCALIRRNLEALSLLPTAEVVPMEVQRAIPFLAHKAPPYDIIFMDPPYDKGYVTDTAALVRASAICRPDTLLVAEHSKREACGGPASVGDDRFTRRYGDTCVTMCTMEHENNKRSPR